MSIELAPTLCLRRGCRKVGEKRGYCHADYSWAAKTGKIEVCPLVDASEARERIDLLHSKYGMPYREIGERIGGSTTGVNAIARGVFPTMRLDLHDAIMAIPLQPSTTSWMITDPAGTLRRIESLRRDGWSLPEVIKRTPLTLATVRSQIRLRRITYKTRAEIARVFDDLAGTRGPNPYIAGRYRSAPPALAWDEERIDVPHAKPRGVLVDAA